MGKPVIMEADSQAENNGDNLEKQNIDEIRQQTAHILTTLLETGECDIGSLSALMNVLSVHTSSMMQIKEKYEEQVTEAERELQTETEIINLVNKLFNSVKRPEVWENFTLVQRKSIDSWIQEFEASHGNNTNCDTDVASAYKRIRLENDAQTSMLNEMMELLEEGKILLDKIAEVDEENKELERILIMQKSRLQQLTAARTRLQLDDEEPSSSSDNASTKIVTPEEMYLVGLISIFLSSYRCGATIHCICFYLNQFDYTIEARDVESLMKKFPLAFEECIGVGSNLEKKWYFRSFQRP